MTSKIGPGSSSLSSIHSGGVEQKEHDTKQSEAKEHLQSTRARSRSPSPPGKEGKLSAEESLEEASAWPSPGPRSIEKPKGPGIVYRTKTLDKSKPRLMSKVKTLKNFGIRDRTRVAKFNKLPINNDSLKESLKFVSVQENTKRGQEGFDERVELNKSLNRKEDEHPSNFFNRTLRMEYFEDKTEISSYIFDGITHCIKDEGDLITEGMPNSSRIISIGLNALSKEGRADLGVTEEEWNRAITTQDDLLEKKEKKGTAKAASELMKLLSSRWGQIAGDRKNATKIQNLIKEVPLIRSLKTVELLRLVCGNGYPFKQPWLGDFLDKLLELSKSSNYDVTLENLSEFGGAAFDNVSGYLGAMLEAAGISVDTQERGNGAVMLAALNCYSRYNIFIDSACVVRNALFSLCAEHKNDALNKTAASFGLIHAGLVDNENNVFDATRSFVHNCLIANDGPLYWIDFNGNESTSEEQD